MRFMSVYLHTCMCTIGTPSPHTGQKKALDPAKLELEALVSHPAWVQRIDSGSL